MSSAQEFVLFTGPMLIGTIFNWALLGVLTVQVYLFYITFPKERQGIKLLVYSMYILDLFQTAGTTYFAWFMLVGGWGDTSVFVTVPWPGIAQPIVTGIISAMAQIYFAWRISVLKRNNMVFRGIALIIVLVALMQCSCAMANGIKLSLVLNVADIANLTPTVNAWLGGSFAVDIIIALTMIFILANARRDSISRRTDALLKRLIVSTVETGAVTAVTAGADLFLFLANKSNYLHLCPSLLLGKLYSIVVVASLNGRTRVTSNNNTYTSDFDNSLESHRLGIRTDPKSGVSTERTIIHVSTNVKSHGDTVSSSSDMGFKRMGTDEV